MTIDGLELVNAYKASLLPSPNEMEEPTSTHIIQWFKLIQ